MSGENPESKSTKIAIVDMPNSNGIKHTKYQGKYGDVQKVPDDHDNTRQPYLQMFTAEVISTGLLMFMGCMGNMIPQMGAISFGLSVLTQIQIFGHISGAHMNPAVTIATVLFGILSPMMGAVYIVAQFIGATLGYGLLKLLTPNDYCYGGFCATTLNDKFTVMQGLGQEIVITTVLILVCCGVWDKRNSDKADSTPIRFGLIVFVISTIAGKFTGASMNTARSVAPLVYGGSWDNQWIYFVGPNVAPFIACGIYKFLFSVSDKEEEQKAEVERIYLKEVSQNNGEKVYQLINSPISISETIS